MKTKVENTALESIRQRELLKALRLLEEAFDIAREPLGADEESLVWKPEVKITLLMIGARDALREFVGDRDHRLGIRAAK